MHRSISLVGMPGGGKSTVGRHLSRRFGVPLVDTDAAIEDRIGVSIRSFFECEGEARFRAIEKQILAETIDSAHGVIATGGGIVLDAENRQALHDSTICIYLRSAPDELHRRIRHDVKRPLLRVEDPLARLRELYEARDPLYREAAHFIVETGRPSIPALVNVIVSRLELEGIFDSAHAPPPPATPDA